jgi:hypothetical protein
MSKMKMMALIKFRVEDGLKPLMLDPEFRQRVIRAYENQVERHHGWGFTVKYKGYRVKFQYSDADSTASVAVYRGYAEEQPQSVQKSLLEAFRQI